MQGVLADHVEEALLRESVTLGEADEIKPRSIEVSSKEGVSDAMSTIRRCLFVMAPTLTVVAMWTLVGANYYHLAILRGVAWSPILFQIAYVLLALTISSYLLTMMTAPGAPPDAWVAAAESGLVPAGAVRDERSGLWVPPRARFVRRADSVVLHLDHFCAFLHAPIGLRNRKFFVLFAVYALGLVCLALALDLSEWITLHARASDLDNLLPGVNATGVTGDLYKDILFERQHAAVYAQAYEALGATYMNLLWLPIPANAIACWFVGDLACRSLWLAARGRTWLEPDDETYDVGWRDNLRAVMGDHAVLWALPLPRTGPSGDGLSWDTNPDAAKQD